MIKISQEKISSLENFVKIKTVPYDEIHLAWLGQAGFAMKFKDKLLLMDPYLSDYLSKKYKGKLFPHVRLMEIPLLPEKIKNLDYICCSHAHSDHMDPETLSVLSHNNPDCKIVVPGAEIEEAVNRGARRNQIIPANDGKIIQLEKIIRLIGIGASHEVLKINEQGEHHFLGFIFDFSGIKIYHSGDCIPYEGLIEKLKELQIDLALLPINGRDEYRLNNNIAGNFKIPEVIELCEKSKIYKLIVHHFGMFAYNTVSKEDLNNLRKKSSSKLEIIIPEINQIYKIKKK
jgi:L-ascorbate metabolism protein UlaG (beta-lactamase superfamily)